MNPSFGPLTKWQQQVFSAGLLQRMLPNYGYFAQANQVEHYPLLRNQIDLVWQILSKRPVKINLEAQLEKLELAIPEKDLFDMFAVYPAIDACTGLVCLLQSLEEKETQCSREISLLSINSVESFIRFTTAQQLEKDLTEEVIQEDPLMQWELAMQQTLYDLVSNEIEGRETCDQVKLLVTQDKLSSLGIEY